MAAEVVRDLADTIIGNKDTVEALELDLESSPSAATVILVDDAPLAGFEKFYSEDPSGYTLTCESGYSRDVERWMRGDSPARAPPPAPSGDSASASQPRVSPAASCGRVAAALASLSNGIRPEWTSCILFSKLEQAAVHGACLCARAQRTARRLTEEQALRQLFAAAMDAVLVVYAVGFLLLSLCQTSLLSF